MNQVELLRKQYPLVLQDLMSFGSISEPGSLYTIYEFRFRNNTEINLKVTYGESPHYQLKQMEDEANAKLTRD